jgi:hypothetical protein
VSGVSVFPLTVTVTAESELRSAMCGTALTRNPALSPALTMASNTLDSTHRHRHTRTERVRRLQGRETPGCSVGEGLVGQ